MYTVHLTHPTKLFDIIYAPQDEDSTKTAKTLGAGLLKEALMTKGTGLFIMDADPLLTKAGINKDSATNHEVS